MKKIVLINVLLLAMGIAHSQNFIYTDTIVTTSGYFILETDQETFSDVSYNQQTQIAADGGYSEQLNFFQEGFRMTAPKINEQISVTINPNPAYDIASILIKNGGSDLTIKIVDITGRLISEQNYYSIDGTYLRSIDLVGFTSGIYFLDIISGEQHLTKKLVKQ